MNTYEIIAVLMILNMFLAFWFGYVIGVTAPRRPGTQ